ncbi:hypothetical protein [Sediminibacillus albus]|uniref:Uncharacterized protein n=1 Tax=Sediminibacillus albus TaxID=407036 RepID=A0A1G9C7L4_9BACI|nr:hypothetical protein [Sediminibacillus albus]SDK47650.1 hypothetical protein SAMN05216243_3295 [Sediminibacillus albus]
MVKTSSYRYGADNVLKTGPHTESFNNEVKTYYMPVEERLKRMKMNPASYVEMKEAGLSDKKIREKWGIDHNKLQKMKNNWDFVNKTLDQMKQILKKHKTTNSNKQRYEESKKEKENLSPEIDYKEKYEKAQKELEQFKERQLKLVHQYESMKNEADNKVVIESDQDYLLAEKVSLLEEQLQTAEHELHIKHDELDTLAKKCYHLMELLKLSC